MSNAKGEHTAEDNIGPKMEVDKTPKRGSGADVGRSKGVNNAKVLQRGTYDG